MQTYAPHSEKIGKTLMIVEDEVLVAITLRDELEHAGFHVLDLTDRHEQARRCERLIGRSGQSRRARDAYSFAVSGERAT